MGFFSKLFGVDNAVGKVIGGAGKAVGSLMNRLGFTEKMSEIDKVDASIRIIKATTESDKLDAGDLKSARELAIVQMQTQKASWFVRQMNGALRPFAGWYSLICLTDKYWGQMLSQIFESFTWVPIETDPITKSIFAGILAFFFGFRQRAKEKMVNLNG